MAGDYQVQFSGQVYRGADPQIVQSQMAQLFGQPVARMAALFTGEVFVIKENLSREEAERYQVQLAKIGARSDVIGGGGNTDAPAGGGRGDSSSHFTHGDISVAMMICPKCGHQQLEADFCSRCGANIEQAHKELRLRAKEDVQIQRELEALRREAIVRDHPEHADAVAAAPQARAEPQAGAAPQSKAAPQAKAGPNTQGVSAVDPAQWLLGVGAGLRLVHHGADLLFLDLVSLLGLALYLTLATGDLDLTALTAALGALQADPFADVVQVLVVLGSPALVMTLCWLVLGASPGMLLVGARILDADTGNRAGFWPLLLRGPALVVALLPLGLGVFWGYFSQRRRAWHDLLTGTVVAKPV